MLVVFFLLEIVYVEESEVQDSLMFLMFSHVIKVVYEKLSLRLLLLSEGPKGGAQAAGATEDELSPARLDMRIGKILSVEKVSLN